MVVVWSFCSPVSRVERFRQAFGAFVFHYQRVVMGPQFRMGGA